MQQFEPRKPTKDLIVNLIAFGYYRCIIRAEKANEGSHGQFDRLVYADDNLLVDAGNGNVQEYIEYICAAGAQYGLGLNPKKVEALNVRCDNSVLKPDGSEVAKKDNMVYLGGPALCRRSRRTRTWPTHRSGTGDALVLEPCLEPRWHFESTKNPNRGGICVEQTDVWTPNCLAECNCKTQA